MDRAAAGTDSHSTIRHTEINVNLHELTKEQLHIENKTHDVNQNPVMEGIL
jgi:hypothetical protein